MFCFTPNLSANFCCVRFSALLNSFNLSFIIHLVS
nr:MAG TPA: hypothetical protein [Caudoviricetes sp.]